MLSAGIAPATAMELDPPLATLGPVLWWLAALGGLLIVFAIGALARHSRRQTETATQGEQPNRGSKRGVLWAAFVLIIALGMPVADVILFDSPRAAGTLEVHCTASQWKWHFAYQSYQQQPITGLAFTSAMRTPPHIDNRQLAQALFSTGAPASKADELLEVDQPLVLPAGAKVRFVITSEDSIHAWWIPAFNVKKEAIPGFLQNVEIDLPATPGTYRGMCSQLCGQDHAFMPIVVQLLPVAAFETWLRQQPTVLSRLQQRQIPDTLPETQLMMLGQSVYRERCELCHGQDGNSPSPRIPSLQNNALLKGDQTALLQFLLNGRNVMPGMRGILATDELAALATYVRMTWGAFPPSENGHRATVQPIDVSVAF